MRVRTIELRILGLALTGLWIAAFALVLLGYRPGGPIDLAVGLALVGPIAVAIAGVVWPPVARGDRAFAAIVWLGLGAVLLLVPSLGGLIGQLTARGPQTLLPSLEAAYPWLLALAATGLFAGLGVARRRLGETSLRRRRLLVGTLLGAGFVMVTGATFTAAAVVNELALDDRPAISSRFGPTDPSLEPPQCGQPMEAGATAQLELRMDAAADGRRTGQLVIEGSRSGADFRWSGYVASSVTLGEHGLARIGNQAWALEPPNLSWAAVPLAAADGGDLDRRLVAAALTPGIRAVAEDRGLSFIEGAHARHCRVAMDGETLRAALPVVALLVGTTDVSRWRGLLDFWVFGDDEIGQADGQLSGPATGLAENALTATLRFRITATDRAQPVIIRRPVR